MKLSLENNYLGVIRSVNHFLYIQVVGRSIYLKRNLQSPNNNSVTVDLDNQAGSIQPHWKIIPDDSGQKNVTIYPECHTLDLCQYKEDLWTCFKPILEAYGFTRDELIKLRNKLVDYRPEV
jgi:hypothetical protein